MNDGVAGMIWEVGIGAGTMEPLTNHNEPMEDGVTGMEMDGAGDGTTNKLTR
jgi:hypothetical protein